MNTDSIILTLAPAGPPGIPTGNFSATYDAVVAFGVKADGVTDNSTVLNTAIVTVGSAGGGIIQLPRGIIAIVNTVVCNYSSVMLIGYGTDVPHKTGTPLQFCATILQWTGVSSPTNIMVSWATPDGNVNGLKMSGGGVCGIGFNSGVTTANTGAGVGLEIKSWSRGYFANNLFYEMQTTGINMNLVTTLFDVRDSENNIISNNLIWNQKATLNLNADGIQLNGDVNQPSGGSGGTGIAADIAENYFYNNHAQMYNGVGYHLFDSDHNYFYSCTAGNVGTGYGVVLEGSNGTAGACRDAFFIGYTGATIWARATGYTTPSTLNLVDLMDTNTVIIVDSGAQLACGSRTDGSFGYCSSSPLAIYQNQNMLAQFDNLSTGAFGGLRLGNAPTSGPMNPGDLLTLRGAGSQGHGASFANTNSQVAAFAYCYFGNATNSEEASIILNGSANTSGNGVNSFTINGNAGLWLQGGGNNGIEINPSGNVEILGPVYINGVLGFTGSGSPTSGFTVTNGIVTHL